MTPPIASVSEWTRRFATLPLMHQPGARWMYNTSLEVLSVLVARAAGLAIVTATDALTGTSGRYGWDGGLGTSWCSDPARGLVGILMSQRAAFPPMAGVYRDFWKTAYRAEGRAP
jgi:CubicO group peptidase (beta-lactamase class C family)